MIFINEREIEQFELDLKNPDLLKSPSKSSSQNTSLNKRNEVKRRYYSVAN